MARGPLNSVYQVHSKVAAGRVLRRSAEVYRLNAN